ncbi:hypothetical protein L593_09700 [Salinarchaeum sp. Harcht-Bsk1]|uniref:DUF58 domain-containing protein n=1 Tax=Salinarchaeum sp. Harcht-Bsk1 TaxID=1333523 RepID=UPI0003422D5F|nr:DUF58 domain-containing protein [Salinarchaeum sp. Harcht-Bsk1]AGN01885.1 hypothetical protein L593_09700 [Salinarchaeum sp. Harcht-Bsk1]
MTAQSIPAAARTLPTEALADDDPGYDEEIPRGLRRTNRWRGVAGLTLLAIGLGLLLEQPAALLAGVFGVAFAAYGQIGAAPTPELDVERTIDVDEPAVGDEVPVTVTVTNEGEDTLTDLRLVDGVPDGLAVADGAPRGATALRPGSAVELTYEVVATRGAHAFDSLVAITRDVTGATERVVEVDAPDRIICTPELPADPPSFPLRAQTTRYTGRTTAEEGGDGVEFHATREYRPGDPLSRIDWRRTARTRDLTTVEYRRERAASVMLVVDARKAAYASHEPHAETSVDRCVDAARTVAASLLADGHSVGLTAVSPRACWITPGHGLEHRLAITTTLAEHESFARRPPEESTNVYGAGREIRGRIASDTQVVVFSPLIDDGGAQLAHRFDAHGHLTTVVSPDPCVTDTVGQQTATISRALRITQARHGGLPTIDWQREERLERALLRSNRRWSA